MPRPEPLGNFEVLGFRRRGFTATRTPSAGVVRFSGATPSLQLTNDTGPQPVARLPFSDGFESGNANAWDVNVGMAFTQSQRYAGSWSSQITAPGGGTPNDNYLEYNFGDQFAVGGQGVGQRDLWIRFAHKWASNWQDNGWANLQKLMLLNITNPATGRRRYQLTFNIWTPNLMYFCEFLRIDEDGSFNGAATANTDLNYTRVLGVWEEFVFRVRMNTPGALDGILQIWSKREGESAYTQRVDRVNINYRDSTTFAPNRIIQSNYQPDGMPSGQRWWDYWLVTEEPIDVSGGQPVVSDWPEHSPGYVSVLPGTGGYGMNTSGGDSSGATVIFIDSLNSGNSGTAINASLSAALNWPTPTFVGTPEYAARHAASPKVILPITSGIATIQASIPNQTGTPPRPGLTTYYGQSAPNPGLILRGCNWALNGGGGHVVWHMKSWMGDDVAGLPADNRDCLSSGYSGGVTQQVVLINCEFQWSVDEIVDFYRAHNQLTFLDCAFIEPLHDSIIEHTGDPTNTDHGFGPMVGGDTATGQPSAVSTFRCLWAHSTGRNPFTNATTFCHANNLHYNHGRPVGINADGNAVQIAAQAATDPMFANILCNGFIRGPNNRGNLVAVSVSATLPPGSQGYSFGNAQFGWTAPSSQNGFFTSSPTAYAVTGLIDGAIPDSWGVGLSGVLQWAANPLAPTSSEWHGYVDKMERTVGASPRWRTPANSRLRLVFQQMRDRLNGVAQSDQFVNTVAQAGGWPTISQISLHPLAANATHWHAPLPTGPDRDTPYTSGTFSDGRSRFGYTRLRAWGYEQHLFVMRVDVTAPTVPGSVNVSALSTTALSVSWTPSADTQSGVAAYRVYRSTTVSGTYTRVGPDIAFGTNTYSDTSLSAGQTRFYKVSAVDVAGNESAQSAAASGVTHSSSGGGLVLTSWANLNLAANPINGINFAAQDYPVWTPDNATYHTYIAGGAWDGSPAVRIRGSQVAETACGTGNWVNLWRNGSLAIRRLNFRFQARFGATMIQNWRGGDWKWIIIQTNPTLINSPDPGGGERPMMHFAYNAETNTSGPHKLGWSVACSTVGNFNRTPPFTEAYWPSVNADAFLGAAAGTFNGKPVIGPNEWINFEMEAITQSTPAAPNGLIRGILTRRNGQRFELSIPWNYDDGWTVGDYIHGVQLIGGYFNQAVTASDANTYYELANLVFAANQTQELGPPDGFVQV